jgi:type IV secretory pathway VirB10-like protein
MNNRTLWTVVAAGAAILLFFAVIARQHATQIGSSQPTPPVEITTPDPARPDSPRGRRNFTVPMPPPAPPASDTDLNAPQTQPTTRAVPGRPLRAQKFTDAVADAQLTPQKVARVALSYVGADPAADEVWLAAINNPHFTPNERKDLIEDLNEEGFDDPRNLTAADVPLIVSRIQIIENLAPQSADEVNAAAFAEAYKDLVNMLAKLTK